MSNHTPGPWQIEVDESIENVYRLWDAEGNYHQDCTLAVRIANKQLMEAAPELLAALKVCQNYLAHCTRIEIDCSCSDYPSPVYPDFSIIGKAEGRAE